MFCSGSRFENVRAGPASYVVFGARKLTSKRSRSGNAVRSEPWLNIETKQKACHNESIFHVVNPTTRCTEYNMEAMEAAVPTQCHSKPKLDHQIDPAPIRILISMQAFS